MTIWTLQTAYIQNILARYAPGSERRASAARHLAQHAALRFGTRSARDHARVIGQTLILNPWAGSRLNTLFNMSREEWRVSRQRQLAVDLRAYLIGIDVDSLTAWRRAVDNLHLRP